MTHHASVLSAQRSASGSIDSITDKSGTTTLSDAIARHLSYEASSFHTPGHKGRALASGDLPEALLRLDLTELPGLDDLSDPSGVLADLERRAARLWRSGDSVISVNGASAGLTAAMLAIAGRSDRVLVPRNVHRSAVSGLILSGLFPVWYDPIWEDQWGLWGPISATSAERLIARTGGDLAGMIVVSPTYAGAISEIGAIAELCRFHNLPLVVDEAHGCHFLPGPVMPASAVSLGADLVVHSLHKTLSGLTQTGLIHVGRGSLIEPRLVRRALRLIQSSSPSYILLAAVEKAIRLIEQDDGLTTLTRLARLSETIKDLVKSLRHYRLYRAHANDPAHILVGLAHGCPEAMYEYLLRSGIFPEAMLGKGVLFMLGAGTTSEDVASLTSALIDFHSELVRDHGEESWPAASGPTWRPADILQVISPRRAVMMPSHVVPACQAVGKIAAETVAPCPPGVPVLVPGQRIPPDILEFATLQEITVVLE